LGYAEEKGRVIVKKRKEKDVESKDVGEKKDWGGRTVLHGRSDKGKGSPGLTRWQVW